MHICAAPSLSRSMLCIRQLHSLLFFMNALKNHWFRCMHCGVLCCVVLCSTVFTQLHAFIESRLREGFAIRKENYLLQFLIVDFFSLIFLLLLSCVPVFHFRNFWNTDECVLHVSNVISSCMHTQKMSTHQNSLANAMLNGGGQS